MDEHILLVEADMVLGAVIVEILRRSRYEVIVVRTLKGAEVERICVHPVSAVLLDVDTIPLDSELPRLSLLQPYTGSLPIVLMGTQVPKNLYQRLHPYLDRQQATHLVWVQKPFRNEEFLVAVRRAQRMGSSQPIGEGTESHRG